MNINFALSLSHDGIEMLQRVPNGWRRVGCVDVASDTLSSDLNALKEKTDRLSVDVLSCKLLIPADQIKYTSVAGALTQKTDIDAVLVDATPYALSDLVVDFAVVDGQTHIAAVARETLQDAENFAAAHGFNPVAFVAVPPADSFVTEVFFGPTSAMPAILGTDATVERDTAPVGLAEESEAATPVLFDRIIPQYHPALKAAPKIAVVAAQAPVAAPVRAPSALPEASMTPKYIAIAASVLVLAGVVGWTQIGSQPQLPSEPTEVAEVSQPIAGPDVALQSAPSLASATPTEIAPFAGIQPARDPVLALLTEVTNLAAPEAPTPPPQAPQIGPRMFTVATPLFGEFAPQTTNLPTRQITQDASPRFEAPVLAQATAPDADVATPQAPPPAPVRQAPVVAAAAPPNGAVLSPAEADAFYEATGVWQRSPRLIDTPSGAILFGFARPSELTTPPRVSPPVFAMRPVERAVPFATPRNPPAPDVIFARDENGFIAATPEGTLTPDGAVIVSGLPDLPVRPRPALSEADIARLALLAPAAPADGVIVVAGSPPVTPPLRPRDFIVAEPTPEPEVPLGGVGLAALELQQSGTIALDTATVENRAATDLRPQLRPSGLQAAPDPNTTDITDILREIAASDATLRFDNSTALAVRASIRPDTRPNGFAQVVAAAQVTPPTTAAGPIVAAAPVPPQNFDPVPGGVARAATQEDVIRLREINLIGVYGRPNARRALVRLSNGRYVRVEVGSALDGGQVTAIGDEALNYVKRGRTYAVELPSQ